MPLLVRAWDQAPASNPLKAKLKDPIELLRKWDHRWARRFGAAVAGLLLGRGDLVEVGRRRPRRRRERLRVHPHEGHAAAAARGAGGSRRQAHRRLREVGRRRGARSTASSASHRRHRAPLRRRQAEHSGGLHVGALGLAGVVRRPLLQRQQEDLRHQRQQLRGRGGVRQGRRARQGGDRRRPEQRRRARSTSTTRPSATPPATCARSTSTRSSSRATPSAPTSRGSSGGGRRTGGPARPRRRSSATSTSTCSTSCCAGASGRAMRVLDAGCGGGRNLVYLLRAGLRRLGDRRRCRGA